MHSPTHPLAGTWRPISNQVTINGEPPRDYPGPNPRGHLILTPEGRMMALMVAGKRSFGDSDTAQAALLKSMLAYSGKYRIEGNDFVTMVDVSWNDTWSSTSNRHVFFKDGDALDNQRS